MATQTQPSVVLTKQVNAPRQKVFDAWIKPELRRQWWRASPEMSCTVCEIDARKSGHYRIGMRKPAGAPGPHEDDDQPMEYIVEGDSLDIDPPSKLVFTWGWTQPSDGVTDSTVTVHFADQDGGTLVTVTHERLPSDESRDSHRGGWTGCAATRP